MTTYPDLPPLPPKWSDVPSNLNRMILLDRHPWLAQHGLTEDQLRMLERSWLAPLVGEVPIDTLVAAAQATIDAGDDYSDRGESPAIAGVRVLSRSARSLADRQLQMHRRDLDGLHAMYRRRQAAQTARLAALRSLRSLLRYDRKTVQMEELREALETEPSQAMVDAVVRAHTPGATVTPDIPSPAC